MNCEVQNGAEDVSAVSYAVQMEKPLKWARFVRKEGA